MKNSFVLFNDLIDTVAIMNDSDAGALFKMILNYENDRDITEDVEYESMQALIAFTFVQRQLDRLAEQYEQTKQARIEAGRKGAEARWHSKGIANDSKAMANDGKRILPDGNGMAKMPINVPVPVNNISPLPPKAKPPASVDIYKMLDDSELDARTKESVTDWLTYKKEQFKFAYQPTGFKAFLTEIHNNEMSLGVDAVCEAIRLSMGKGYKGIIWDLVKGKKAPAKGNKFNEFPQNQYDYDELERALIQN